MIKRIDHVAMVVNSVEEALGVFESVFGLKSTETKTIPEQGVKVAVVHVGGDEIELLEPIDPEVGIARFLEKRGEGFHHICLEVDNIDEELKSMEAKGVELIDKQARMGLAGKVAFLHPRAAKGVLIELIQRG